VSRQAVHRLREALDGEVPWTPEARGVFLDILRGGSAAVPVLYAMDAGGLLAALLPGWEPIRAFPQRDLYHRFTVDMHLYSAVAELAESRGVSDADVADAWSRVGDDDAMFVGALLHDVGKGRGGDHSAIGASIAGTIAERIGLASPQVEDVGFLVREHLALPELAVHRDLNDPRTIADLVGRVGDERRLAMLFLLTRADSLATGPETWSAFRASLIRELYAKALASVRGRDAGSSEADRLRSVLEAADGTGPRRDEIERIAGAMPPAWLTATDPASAVRQLALLREPLRPGEVRTAVHTGGAADEFVVVAADRPGLFAAVSGTLALRGVDVHAAEIYTMQDGAALEVFRVHGAHGPVTDERWERIRSDIPAVLKGELDLEDALRRKAAHVLRRPGIREPSSVRVDNDASSAFTVVEIRTPDRVGLLRLITRTLTRLGCDLRMARVATYGTRAVDVFYVLDAEGSKIVGADRSRSLEATLLRALGG
jgi:[protein-PII] uridylyltransferase